VLEYVSKGNRRKDYDDNMRKYEHELKVPYYLLFVLDQQELTLYRHTGERYLSVPPDGQGRCAIAELELSLGLKEGWVRYWYQGQLLPLHGDLQRDLDSTRQKLAEMTNRAEVAERESAQLRAQLDEWRSRESKNR
jgi:hypothetical protein